MNIVVVVVEHRCINLTRFYSIPSAITQRTILLWDLVKSLSQVQNVLNCASAPLAESRQTL